MGELFFCYNLACRHATHTCIAYVTNVSVKSSDFLKFERILQNIVNWCVGGCVHLLCSLYQVVVIHLPQFARGVIGNTMTHNRVLRPPNKLF